MDALMGAGEWDGCRTECVTYVTGLVTGHSD